MLSDGIRNVAIGVLRCGSGKAGTEVIGWQALIAFPADEGGGVHGVRECIRCRWGAMWFWRP